MKRRLKRQVQDARAMTDKNQPKEITTIYLKPPVATDASSPPYANNIRVIGGADGLIVHCYYISSTRLFGAPEGHPQPGVSIVGDGTTAMIEAEPVARVAMSVTTAAELAFLLIKNIVEGAPEIANSLTLWGGTTRGSDGQGCAER
jgi:hypothetical protein